MKKKNLITKVAAFLLALAPITVAPASGWIIGEAPLPKKWCENEKTEC